MIEIKVCKDKYIRRELTKETWPFLIPTLSETMHKQKEGDW